MNYGDVKAQFTGLMNRRDLTANTSLIETFCSQGIQRIQRELRIPALEKGVQVTIDGSTYAGLVIPADLIELKSIYPITDTEPKSLQKVSLDQARAQSRYVGIPCVYARQGGVWVLGPQPADQSVLRIDYWAEAAPLVNASDENILTSIAWDLIVNAALCAACEYYKDARLGDFEQRYQQILSDLEDQADQDELGDDACVQPALHFPCDN